MLSVVYTDSVMLNVTFNLFIQSVIMINVIMVSVEAPPRSDHLHKIMIMIMGLIVANLFNN
jgi:hypothetical protein